MSAATTPLFRAVSVAEYQDILDHNVLRTVNGSLEGKWFATSRDHATRWGKLFEPFSGPFQIIEVSVLSDQLSNFQYRAKLDGIGPAYYADTNQLQCIIITKLPWREP